MIRIAILGSTGSIGRSALEVVSRHPDRFQVVALVANTRADALAEQVRAVRPDVAVLCDPAVALPEVDGATRWHSGMAAALDVCGRDDVDVVLNALVGAAGLRPTVRALEAGHRVALANKESLVAGGPVVMAAVRAGEGAIVPVDSEHSAILQCIDGAAPSAVQRVVLTASGGPFRGMTWDELADVGPRDALRHPTWDMGAKITIDSATLANKALEVIEAHFLYGLSYDRIDAVVHPQSVIHSFVEFVDGSVLAQLGFPTMELPILYALTWPERVCDDKLRTFDPLQSSPLTFEGIDRTAFPMYELGVEAGRRSGSAPAVYNAANEVAVEAFLEGRIRFHDISRIVESTMDAVGATPLGGLDDVIAADRAARRVAREGAGSMGT